MKYFIRLTVLSLVVVFGFAQAAQAAQYYVDSSYTGSTSNGGINTPWKTLSQVQSATLQPGDIVSFKRGTNTNYTGTLNINRSGVSGNPITFNTYGTGAAPTFTGTGSTIQNLFFIGSNVSHLVFDGFNVTDPTLNAADPNHAQMAKIQRVFTVYGSYVTIKNMTIELSGAAIVFFGPNNTLDSSTITNLRMLVNTCSSFNSSGVCTQVGNGDDQDYGANPVTILSAGNTVTNNTFEGCWAPSYDYGYDGGAIELYGTGTNNNLIAYNTISNCVGLTEIAGDSINNTYAYNKLINTGSLFYFQPDNRGLGATFSGWKFYNNTVIGTAAPYVPESRMIGGSLPCPTPTPCPVILDLKNNVFQLSNGVDVASSNGAISHTYNAYKLSNNSIPGFTLNSNEISTSAPLFSSTTGAPENWNYYPLSTSPLINAGTNVGITRDIAGVTVPQGSAPDIGSYEYTSGTPAPDTTAPTVLFTSPASGATVSGTTTVSANAADNVGVVGVQFKLNGANLGSEDTTSPYSVSWTTTGVANGTYTLTAVARDAAGNTGTATTTVIVNNTVTPPADTTAPTVSFTSPASGATVSGTTTVTADASDNVGVASVAFTLDGILHTTDTTAPYSASWITTGVADGSHTWTAVARDAAGNVSTTATRSFTVSNASTTPSIPTGLTATATSSTSVTLSWNSSGPVYGYELWKNGVNIGHTVGPATTYVDTDVVANTTYTYAVSAIYPCDCDETAQSTPVSVTTLPVTVQYKTTARVNVRANPTVGATGTILGTQSKGMIGTVIGGPVSNNGYIWYKLDFSFAPDGWVATRNLVLYTAARTTTTSRTSGSTLPTEPTTTTPVSSLQALELLQQVSRATTTAEANRLLQQVQALQAQ